RYPNIKPSSPIQSNGMRAGTSTGAATAIDTTISHHPTTAGSNRVQKDRKSRNEVSPVIKYKTANAIPAPKRASNRFTIGRVVIDRFRKMNVEFGDRVD